MRLRIPSAAPLLMVSTALVIPLQPTSSSVAPTSLVSQAVAVITSLDSSRSETTQLAATRAPLALLHARRTALSTDRPATLAMSSPFQTVFHTSSHQLVILPLSHHLLLTRHPRPTHHRARQLHPLSLLRPQPHHQEALRLLLSSHRVVSHLQAAPSLLLSQATPHHRHHQLLPQRSRPPLQLFHHRAPLQLPPP